MRHFIRNLLATMVIMGTAATGAESYPDIFKDTPREIVSATTVAKFPPVTFLESIICDSKNNLFFTSYLDGNIYKRDRKGKISTFAKIDGNAAGIAFNNRDGLLIAGTATDDTVKTGKIYHINKKGDLTDDVQIEGASYFLNSITPLNDTVFLIADSHFGKIWQYNAETKESALWLDHTLLKSPLPEDTEMRIGVNGLKIYDDTLYATNTQLQKIVKIPIRNGTAGNPELFADHILGDDFSIDNKKNLYVATHMYNSIVRINAAGEKTVIAEDLEGMTGCTASVFGNGEMAKSLFVVTTGGMLLPPEGGIREARVVRLDITENIHTK